MKSQSQGCTSKDIWHKVLPNQIPAVVITHEKEQLKLAASSSSFYILVFVKLH